MQIMEKILKRMQKIYNNNNNNKNLVINQSAMYPIDTLCTTYIKLFFETIKTSSLLLSQTRCASRQDTLYTGDSILNTK